jgi:cysteinyl-tRNA synthetase
MTVGDVGGILGIVSVFITVGVWLFKRGADVGVLATKFQLQGSTIETLRKRLDSMEKIVGSLTKDFGTSWSMKKLKEDVQELLRIKDQNEKDIKAVKELAEEALGLIKSITENNEADFAKDQKQIDELTKHVRAIIAHLKDSIRKQADEKRRKT